MTYGQAPNIGLIGRMRTGKSTAAGHLCESFGYSSLGFADPVRALAERLDPVVFPSPEDPDVDHDGPLRYSDALRILGYEAAKDLYPEFRRILKNIGQGERERDEYVWVNRWEQAWRAALAVDASRPFVVADVRYPNEVARLKLLGFVIVKLTRPSVLDASESHDSEVLTDSLPADYVYENESSPDALFAFLDGVVLSGAGR